MCRILQRRMKLRSFSGICREIGGTDKTDEPRKINKAYL